MSDPHPPPTEASAARAPAEDWRARLAGSGPFGVVAFIVVLLAGITLSPVIGAVLVLIWARVARVPFADIGFVRPRSWSKAVLYGVAGGVVLKLFMKAVVLPLSGAEAVNQQMHFVQGNAGAALAMGGYAFVAAFTEETFFRGYLFERIGAWVGRNRLGSGVALVLSAALFGILHFQQGRLGITNATIVGLVIGAIYLANERRLFLLMVLHATFNIATFAIIYFGLEQTIGSLIFR